MKRNRKKKDSRGILIVLQKLVVCKFFWVKLTETLSSAQIHCVLVQIVLLTKPQQKEKREGIMKV